VVKSFWGHSVSTSIECANGICDPFMSFAVHLEGAGEVEATAAPGFFGRDLPEQKRLPAHVAAEAANYIENWRGKPRNFRRPAFGGGRR
jgi:hypothetical protein